MRIRIARLLIAAGVLVATAAWAQSGPGPAAWESLNRLQSGQRVEVLARDASHAGAFAAFDAQSITVREKGTDHAIARADVREVRIAGRRLRHTAIGAAIGAGGGAALGAAANGNCGGQPFCVAALSKGAWIGLLAGVGAGIGAIVGVLLPAHATLYRAPDSK